MRGGDEKRDRGGQIGAGRCQRAARLRIDQDKQRERDREHDDEILRPQRAAEGDPEQQPVAPARARQRAMERKARQRPERELHHVMIEFRRGEIEIMQPVDDRDRDQRAERPRDRQRRRPHQRESRRHRRLCEQVKGGIDAGDAVDDLRRPPGQRRQLVVAELPFAAVDHGLDQVERQIDIEDGRQQRPERDMDRQEPAEGGARAGRDAVGKRADHPVPGPE